MLALLLVQAVTAAVPATPPERIDLLPVTPQPCADARTTDIVVCGRRRAERLEKLPDRVAGPPDEPLSFHLPGGGTGNVHAVQSTLPGATGAGAVVTFKVPF